MPGHSVILGWLVALPVVGSVVVAALPAAQARRAWVGARAVSLMFGIVTLLVAGMAGGQVEYGAGGMQLGLRLGGMEMGVDGLSMPLVLVAAGMGVIALWSSYGVKGGYGMGSGVKGYFVLVQWWMAAVLGGLTMRHGFEICACFILAAGMMYFLAGRWGTDRRVASARRYLYLALPAAIGVTVAVWARMGNAGFFGGSLGSVATNGHAWEFWVVLLGLGVVAAVLPVHWWLSDVVAESTTPVAMLAVGVMQTLGGYGILRMLPAFGGEAGAHREMLAWCGTVTLAYGALAAMGQKSLKRMAAYGSISMMGFFLLGAALGTPAAGTGAVYLLCGHAIATGMLVFVAGMIEDRVGHCAIGRLGGLSGHMPTFGGWSAVAVLAATGLPGLGVFAGELLVVMGAFERSRMGGGSGVEQGYVWMGVVAVGTMVLLLGCGVWTYSRVFMGEPRVEHSNLARMSVSERWILAVMGVAGVGLGVLPGVVTEAVVGWVGR